MNATIFNAIESVAFMYIREKKKMSTHSLATHPHAASFGFDGAVVKGYRTLSKTQRNPMALGQNQQSDPARLHSVFTSCLGLLQIWHRPHQLDEFPD